MSRSDFLTALRQHKFIHALFPHDDALNDPVDAFARALTLTGGIWDDTFLHSPATGSATLSAYLRAQYPAGSVFCSATPQVYGDRILHAETLASSLKEVDVGVVRARFGVSETGAVFLSEDHLCVNELSTHARHLVVLLDTRYILDHLHQAHKQNRYFNARYTLLIAGPTALADSENALISGAKGVESLRVVGM